MLLLKLNIVEENKNMICFLIISLIVIAVIAWVFFDMHRFNKVVKSIQIGDKFQRKNLISPTHANPFDLPQPIEIVEVTDIKENNAGILFIQYDFLTGNREGTKQSRDVCMFLHEYVPYKR